MKAESISTTISDLQAQLDRHRELTEKKSGIVKSGDKKKRGKGVSRHGKENFTASQEAAS